MTVALITGSAGLIGAETSRFFADKGLEIVGIDNDMRSHFFGKEASTVWSRRRLEKDLRNYLHIDEDIRDQDSMSSLFQRYGDEIGVVIHTAAQPSHDWAAQDPHTDFTVNANGTLNLLEMTRRNCAEAVFIFVSTNKVYGDTPNRLPLIELEKRFELETEHRFHSNGIDESMSIDHNLHSLFGASKAAADLLVQEYGRYFGLKTACFRGGCLTGPGHSGAELHGFLAYLMKCAVEDRPYTVFGYNGKQVRDNLHSWDLANAFWEVFQSPRVAEVYNMGGGRESNCSMLEAIDMCEEMTGRSLRWSYKDLSRVGDHMWWIGDLTRFRTHYPNWQVTRNVPQILQEIMEGLAERGMAAP